LKTTEPKNKEKNNNKNNKKRKLFSNCFLHLHVQDNKNNKKNESTEVLPCSHSLTPSTGFKKYI